MISAQSFVRAAQERGFWLYTGVPCSYLTPFINYVIDAAELRYVGVTNEGDAVALAAGCELGGRRALAMFQNSGLGNAVNPLTSLNYPCRLPVLLIPTLRGEPGGPHDAPQHQFMGQITTRMLELLEIGWEYFPADESSVAGALDRAVEHMRKQGLPYALVMKKHSVSEWPIRSPPIVKPLAEPVARSLRLPPQLAASHPREIMLRSVQASVRPSDIVVSTTGYTTRELYACGDRENQFYMLGAMGCASSLALGLAMAQPARRVIVLDGDGALLMRLGALATIGYERPANLVHILLDNEVHESTGRQSTVSHSVDLCGIAAACGYPRVARLNEPAQLADALRHADGGLTFLQVKIKPGVSGKLPRPAIAPPAMVQRLRDFIARTS